MRDLSGISQENRKKLAMLSKELHELKKDNYNLKKDNYEFKSEWFNKNIKSQLEVFNILEENKYWDVLIDSSLPEYVVNKAFMEECVVKLNSTIDIKFKNQIIAKNSFESFIKNYSGNVLEYPLIINVTEIIGHDKYSDIISLADNKIDDTEKRINDLVSNIYNLDDYEKMKL